MITGVLATPSYPGDLTLDGSKLIPNNVRHVIAVLLKIFSNPIPSKNPNAYLSHTVEGPMIIPITILSMFSRLRRSHKLISNTS